MSLFQGLEMGKRALLAHQLSLNTAGHNISNVNTPGYTRQRVITTNAYPLETPYGQMGIGVDVTRIEHIRDQFLTDRWRSENQNLSGWSTKARTFVQLEGFLNEPQDISLGGMLNDFWAAWQDLSTNPEAPESRNAVLQQAHVVANGFHQLDSQLTDLTRSVDADIASRVDEINSIAAGIAGLNQQIATAELGGDSANDLRDRRDHMIDSLSEYSSVTAREDERGRAIVYIGAMAIVDGSDSIALQTNTVTGDGGTRTTITWQNSKMEVGFSGGEMGALFEMRDVVLKSYKDEFDNLANAIIDEVNEAHIAGSGLDSISGRVFFDPLARGAGGISIALEIESDVTRIAASMSGEVGDGSNALTIADVLKSDRMMNSNTATIEEYYNSIVGTAGMQVREANNQTENYTLLVGQIENSRQSVQGVSLDEEMANMIKFQHAYEAAARVITFIDSALDTLINGTGVTR